MSIVRRVISKLSTIVHRLSCSALHPTLIYISVLSIMWFIETRAAEYKAANCWRPLIWSSSICDSVLLVQMRIYDYRQYVIPYGGLAVLGWTLRSLARSANSTPKHNLQELQAMIDHYRLSQQQYDQQQQQQVPLTQHKKTPRHGVA